MALRTHTKNIISGDYERQIIDAMARAMFVTTWADRMEERGLGHKLSGQKLMDIAPKTSRDALAAAKKLAAMFAKANEGASMNDLYARALNVAGKRRGDTSPHSFGHYMAMEAMGHGVSWTDDHPEFKVNIPYFEYYPGRGAIKGMASGKAHFGSIPQVGDTITYYNARNQKRSGRIVMPTDVADRHGHPGLVVNTGGRHGTPDVVFREQITSIRRGRGGAPALAAPHRKGAAGGYGHSKGMASGYAKGTKHAGFPQVGDRAFTKLGRGPGTVVRVDHHYAWMKFDGDGPRIRNGVKFSHADLVQAPAGMANGKASPAKRVKKLPNGWTLSWFPERPNTVYVDDDKNGSWSDSALQARGKIAYDFPERVPDSVKTAVKSFFREVKRGMAGGYGYSKGMAYGNLSEQDLVKFKPAVERAKAKTHYKKIKRALDEGHAVSREDFAKAYEFESGRPYPHYKGRSKGKKPGCGCKGK